MSKDIPSWAFIEHQVLAATAKAGGLQDAALKVESMYGLRTGYLGNGLLWQPRAVSLLYTLILFPKEFWGIKQQDDPIFTEISTRWSLDDICIVTPDRRYGNTIYGFMHRLRNALAHANVTFRGNDLEIWDSYSGREVYRARIPRRAAEKFLEETGKIMANLRNRTDP